jgi:hypothetical protein
MKTLGKKFFITNSDGKQEELKITPEGSMWILAYGHETIAEWKRIRRKAKLEQNSTDPESKNTDRENTETLNNG